MNPDLPTGEVEVGDCEVEILSTAEPPPFPVSDRIDADETAEAAALRELDEELGLRLDHTTVLGPLDDYPTRSGYRITPVVMWLDGGLGDLSPNPQEVASVHVAVRHSRPSGVKAPDPVTKTSRSK